MTNRCPNCNATNPDDEIVCQGCGLTLSGFHADVAETTRPEHRTLAMEAIAAPDDARTESIDPAGVVEGPSLRIGFSRDNDLVVPVPQVSSHHAELVRTDDGYLIRDLHSTNGTFVNGAAVDSAAVEIGDRIGMGSYEFVFDDEMAARLQRRDRHGDDRPDLTVIIGRDEASDIVLDAPQISRHHVQLKRIDDEHWQLTDLDSANGTFVNDRNHRVQDATVTTRDVLFLGSYRFPLTRVDEFLSAQRDDSPASSRSMRLPDGQSVVTVGRGEDNDVVIDAPQISQRHARLIRRNGQLVLEDLKSANGTFVNGERIRKIAVDTGDTVSFGSVALRLDVEEGTLQKSYRGDILLQAENLRVEVDTPNGKLRILDGVSFTAYPTEFIGLLGPSGAGKTTLLNALIGYTRPTYGRTLLNGDELISHYDR